MTIPRLCSRLLKKFVVIIVGDPVDYRDAVRSSTNTKERDAGAPAARVSFSESHAIDLQMSENTRSSNNKSIGKLCYSDLTNRQRCSAFNLTDYKSEREVLSMRNSIELTRNF